MSFKFSASTDTEHEIKLDSKLIYAVWRSGSAPAGQNAEFEVMTSLVGNGADIKIKGKGEGKTKLGTIKGKIRNNKFIGSFEIPEDAELDELIYFEVKLPKNDLSGESNRIPVVPPVRVTNMKWSEKEARRGDILTLSADVSGCRDGTDAQVTIYEYDADRAHDKIAELLATVQGEKIELQWEYEYHEDTDDILTQEEKEEYGGDYNPPEYFFTIKIQGIEVGKENQDSGLLNFKDWIEIELRDQDGEVIPDEEYVLTLPDGTERNGKLDENGRAIEKDVPPGKCYVRFTKL